jgi:hypothetical protein
MRTKPDAVLIRKKLLNQNSGLQCLNRPEWRLLLIAFI